MNLKKEDIIEIDGTYFITLVTFNEDGVDYAFVNELTPNQEDVTKNYYIITYNNGNYQKVTDDNLINKLSPKLREMLKLEFENIT